MLSGVTAAIGWALIVWHAIASTSTNVITWDYVTYASTRSLHPGAEFDKLLAILLVTFIIALVLIRARDTLLQAVSGTQAAEDLSRFFDREVAAKITGSESQAMAGHAERRKSAVMFIDMRGFTQASQQLDPEGLIALLGEYQAMVVPLIKKHNGSIDKFLGDGVLASFGAVMPSAVYAADSLRAALEIMDAAKEWQGGRMSKGLVSPSVGLAVAAGDVIFGVIGHENRLEYTVLGDVVNLAAKLEKHSKTEKVKALCDLKTYMKGKEQGFTVDLVVRPDRNFGARQE